MKSIFSLLFLLSFIFTTHAQKAKLVLDLDVNETYHQKSSAVIKMVQNINGQSLNIDMTIEGEMDYLVKAENDNEYEMAVSYKKLSLSMNMPGANMSFDSDKDDPNDSFSSVLSAMTGKPFTVLLAKNGKVNDVINLDTLLSTAFEKLADLPAAQKNQMMSQIKQSYGKAAFVGNIEVVTYIFPDKKVKPGQSWETSTMLNSGMIATLNSTFTYKGKEGSLNVIEGSGILTTSVDDVVVNNGMEMNYDVNGTLKSTIKVDQKSGWISEAIITQQLKGDAFIKANAQIPMDMEIPMTIDSETTITE